MFITGVLKYLNFEVPLNFRQQLTLVYRRMASSMLAEIRMVSKCDIEELLLTVDKRMYAGPNFIGVNVMDLYNFVVEFCLFTNPNLGFIDSICNTGDNAGIE